MLWAELVVGRSFYNAFGFMLIWWFCGVLYCCLFVCLGVWGRCIRVYFSCDLVLRVTDCCSFNAFAFDFEVL